MTPHPIHRIAVVTTALLLSTAAFGCVAVYPRPAESAAVRASEHERVAEKPKAPEKAPHVPHHVYRLDFVIAANDPGKAAASSAYTLSLEDMHNGELRMGTNIALSSQARQDVGLMLKCYVEPLGEELLLHSTAEMSSAEEPSTIRKITANGDALLSLGQQALVASVEDSISHKRFEVKVTATKLR
jgi:hypothetical protein